MKQKISKKMKLILIILSIAACISLILLFSALLNQLNEENRFIGTWEDEVGDYIIFFSDNTFKSEEITGIEKGTWEIGNEELTINILGATLIYDYSFSNNDNTLTLISKVSDSIKVLTRQ